MEQIIRICGKRSVFQQNRRFSFFAPFANVAGAYFRRRKKRQALKNGGKAGRVLIF
jgi:hypothetical protein